MLRTENASSAIAPVLTTALEPARPCLRHGRPVGGFSEREDTIAGALRIAGWSIAGISRFLGRSQSTVRARLSTLQGEA